MDWICARDRERTDQIFDTLNPIDGKISGAGKFDIFETLSSFQNLTKICRISKVYLNKYEVYVNLTIFFPEIEET